MARKINVKLILELRDAGMSRSAISTSKVSRNSVSDVLNIADEKHITFTDVQSMSDEEAFRLFYPDKYVNEIIYADPDYEYVHKELKCVGVTLKLLHEEYVDRCQKEGTIGRIGTEQFAQRNIDEKIEQFISRRMEAFVLQYFHRCALQGKIRDMEDYGSYWYDDPVTRTNGEFDCVIKHSGDEFDFYECKYFDREMALEECRQEESQLASIKGIRLSGIGFVCSGGFSFENVGSYRLISGADLYL